MTKRPAYRRSQISYQTKMTIYVWTALVSLVVGTVGGYALLAYFA